MLNYICDNLLLSLIYMNKGLQRSFNRRPLTTGDSAIIDSPLGPGNTGDVLLSDYALCHCVQHTEHRYLSIAAVTQRFANWFRKSGCAWTAVHLL